MEVCTRRDATAATENPLREAGNDPPVREKLGKPNKLGSDIIGEVLCAEQGGHISEACPERLLVPLWNVSGGGRVGTQKLLLGHGLEPDGEAASRRELSQVGSMLEPTQDVAEVWNGLDRKVCLHNTNIG